MYTYPILIVVSLLVVLSYFFDWIARKTKFPSVLLLIITGVVLQLVCNRLQMVLPPLDKILPALGTLGLILIVLEGALELQFTPSKLPVIRKAFFAALVILLSSWIGVAVLLRYIAQEGWQLCLLNAVPFAVISSAIAIPSVSGLTEEKKEFVVYESSFSDILGIVLFNFVLANTEITGTSFLHLGIDVAAVLLLAFVFSLVLLYTMGSITHHVKFFLIIAILILVYAVGKMYHLSTLIIVLIFGLFVNNAPLIKNTFFRKHFLYENLTVDINQFFNLTAESAFLMRTFFFVLFGFTMQPGALLHAQPLLTGLFFFALLFGLRFLYLRFFSRPQLLPAVFIMPRGLISILLFYSIPDEQRLAAAGQSVLLFVVIATSVLMTAGLLQKQKEA